MKIEHRNVQVMDTDTVEMDLVLPADAFWFQGHFPYQAIFPGVAQITVAIEKASEIFDIVVNFHRIDTVKFKKPIIPDASVLLRLQWQSSRRLLIFHLRSGVDQSEYCMGKIVL